MPEEVKNSRQVILTAAEELTVLCQELEGLVPILRSRASELARIIDQWEAARAIDYAAGGGNDD